jgi:imidazolonepropionase-like amidohydrolase
MKVNSNMKTKIVLILMLAINQPLFSQGIAPAALQQQPIAIVNGTIHIGNGEIIQNGLIIIEKGKLVFVGPLDSKTEAEKIKSEMLQIDATDQHIYPSLIAMDSYLGLNEIDAVRATRDYNEVGEINPNVRSIIAYNSDSKIAPTVRTNGILLAEVRPVGGRISGTGSVVQLDAWNWEDALVAADVSMHLNWPWPAATEDEEDGDEEKPVVQKRNNPMLELRKIFDEAKAYSLLKNPNPKNLKYESMIPLFNGRCKLFIHANDLVSITSSVAFAKSYGITPVIVGGSDSWMIAGWLRDNNVAVVLNRTHRLPSKVDDPIDLPYRLPKLLQDSGVLFAISDENSWEQRNLPFQAGTAVAYGLDKEQALMSVSLNPAKILGIDKMMGTLEEGKDATLIISQGDLFDMRYNNVTTALINGRNIPLLNHQQMLYDKYRMKYFQN